MPYEHKSQPVLPHKQWLGRVAHSLLLATCVIGSALSLGVLGYHFIGRLAWIDALLEASMILGGMGAIAPMHTTSIKLFASFYALFSGLVIVSTMGIILAPWLHRVLHRFHVDDGGS